MKFEVNTTKETLKLPFFPLPFPAPVIYTVPSLNMLLSLLWSSYLIASAMALSYAPIYVPCPDNLIRYGNDGLSPHESAYISRRKNKAGLNLLSWIQKLNLTGFDAMEFFANPSNVPTLALAFSGGGYRAMLNGAGVFQGIIHCCSLETNL